MNDSVSERENEQTIVKNSVCWNFTPYSLVYHYCVFGGGW
jgi:hypothetical protein